MLRKFSGSNRVEKGTFCLSPKIRPPELGELLHHGRRAEEEENTEIRVVLWELLWLSACASEVSMPGRKASKDLEGHQVAEQQHVDVVLEDWVPSTHP